MNCLQASPTGKRVLRISIRTLCFVIVLHRLDTIPGRQSMAASHFLHKRFHDVIVYLTSIKVRCPPE